MSEKKEHTGKKRKYLRYRPEDKESLAIFDVNKEASKENFNPSMYGIVFSEGHGGCAVIVRDTNALLVGDRFYMKIGYITLGLGPIQAQVVWRQQIDEDTVKVGIKFTE